MTEAGADLLLAHVGLTTGGTIGAGFALSLDQAVEKVMITAEAEWKVRKNLIVICHGGPFDKPEAEAAALAKMPGSAGFFGATSVERLPTERAITGQVKEFKGLRLG